MRYGLCLSIASITVAICLIINRKGLRSLSRFGWQARYRCLHSLDWLRSTNVQWRTLKRQPASAEREEQIYLEQRRAFGRWDAALDALDGGPRWLEDPRIAQLLVESLHYRHGRVYDLHAFCIMPNHGHAVFTPLAKQDGSFYSLAAIMHSLKRYTAR